MAYPILGYVTKAEAGQPWYLEASCIACGHYESIEKTGLTVCHAQGATS